MIRFISFLVLLTGLSACATSNHPKDPFESFNRSMYSFNKTVDSVALKPVTQAYDIVVPDVVDDRVDNVISNFADIGNTVNALLQGKLKVVGVSLSRLLINSTLGLAGMFDPAKRIGLEQQNEDFGQTLAHWGIPGGPYLMLPLLGPSTLRDTLAKPSPSDVGYKDVIEHVPTRNTAYGIDVINTRQDLLQIDSVLDDAVDEYAYVRDAWMQNREFQIYDGNPPSQIAPEDCDPEYDDCPVAEGESGDTQNQPIDENVTIDKTRAESENVKDKGHN